MFLSFAATTTTTETSVLIYTQSFISASQQYRQERLNRHFFKHRKLWLSLFCFIVSRVSASVDGR